MADKGLFEPSHFASSAPAVLVPKRDGTTRFCIDYRRLNQLTIPDSHPLPRIYDILDALGGSCWFSTLYFESGFHQVSIAEEDRPKQLSSYQAVVYAMVCVTIWTYHSKLPLATGPTLSA